jgi:hypothetical protein
MSQDQNSDKKASANSLGSLREQKAALEQQLDQHNRYLEEVAAFFSSSEEQLRIVMDIRDLRQAMARTDETIAKMTNATSGD